MSVLIWPGGKIEHFARGTTAGDILGIKGVIHISAAAASAEEEGAVADLRVNVDNVLVPEDTVLVDGDLVILARERVKI